MELKGKKVLVTGATGFIGSRLVEVLIEKYKCEISVLVRDFAKLPFIARFPVKIIAGSLDDKIVIEKAVSGVDVIFNLAAAMGGTDEYLRKINVDALENLLEIAMQKRFGRLSTRAPYRYTETLKVVLFLKKSRASTVPDAMEIVNLMEKISHSHLRKKKVIRSSSFNQLLFMDHFLKCGPSVESMH